MTHYSKINVRPAAKVVSSENKVQLAYGPLDRAEAAETAHFCLLMMDCFIDIIDIWNIKPHKFEQNTMLATFGSISNRMFSWLHNVFFKSFQDWLKSVQQHHETLQKMDLIVANMWRTENKC